MAVLPDPKNLDLNVVALARAIRHNESRGKYDAKGQSGEGGAYQFMPAVWKEWAGKYIKDANAPQTPENQNAVAYLRVKEQKDAGLTPAQILSKWNSGSTSWEGKKGVNSQGVAYDVPLYVQKGIQRFQEEVTKLGGKLAPGTAMAATEAPTEPTPQTKTGLLQGITQAVTKLPLRIGLGVARAASGIKTLISGTSQEKAKAAETIGQPKNFGYLGTVAPIGFGEQGQDISIGQQVKQGIGAGAEIASYGVGGGATKNLAKGLISRPIRSAIKQGAISGTLGQGGAELSRDDATTASIAAQSGIGLATGGVLGAVAGAVGSKLVKKSPQLALDDALKLTSPAIDKKAAIQTLERSGMPGGAKKTGVLARYTRVPSNRDIQVAETVKDIVSPTRGPIQNIEAVNREITNVAEKEVAPFLQANPRTFPFKQLNAKLRQLDPPDYVKTDDNLAKTYDLVRQRMIDIAKKHDANTYGLWQARQEFDDLMAQQYGTAVFDPTRNSATKQAIQDTRRTVNDFISDSIGDDTFKTQMRRLSNMYEARTNIAENNYRLLETTGFKRWANQNPLKLKALLYGGAAAGASTGLGVFFGK